MKPKPTTILSPPRFGRHDGGEGLNKGKGKERTRAEHKYQKKGKKEKGRVKFKDSGVNTTAGGQVSLSGNEEASCPHTCKHKFDRPLPTNKPNAPLTLALA